MKDVFRKRNNNNVGTYIRNELDDGSMRTTWNLLYINILNSNIIAIVAERGADEKEKVKLANILYIYIPSI